ncbi:hypothetical protein CDAR_195441 [Caerostris darwini]|uniref:Uncharacterized protein n=1 Tax=Caerostris darwini TaxID=1538125 RepID=A0AAV4NAA0_9ARAC|nr:hypothetical protein CDAR_195441 [Caerostris darwini]
MEAEDHLRAGPSGVEQRAGPRGRVLRRQHSHRAGHRARRGGRLHGCQGGQEAQAATCGEHNGVQVLLRLAPQLYHELPPQGIRELLLLTKRLIFYTPWCL